MDDEQEQPVPRTALVAVDEAMRRWRQAHPQATFAQMEEAVEAALAPLRAQLLTQLTGPLEDRLGRIIGDVVGPRPVAREAARNEPV